MNPIAVLIPTYNRAETVTEAVRLLFANMRGPALHIYVSEDGDALTAIRHGIQALMADAPYGSHVEVVAGPRQGLGANLNSLLHRARNYDLCVQMDDDHHLLSPLYLSPHIDRLISDPTAGAIRLMGVAGHAYTATLDGTYWRVHWDSGELYIASNRPHLKHRRFHHAYGPYPEGLRLGETEEAFCHICKDKARDGGTPNVLIPLNQDDSAWAHVGDSWQLRGL